MSRRNPQSISLFFPFEKQESRSHAARRNIRREYRTHLCYPQPSLGSPGACSHETKQSGIKSCGMKNLITHGHSLAGLAAACAEFACVVFLAAVRAFPGSAVRGLGRTAAGAEFALVACLTALGAGPLFGIGGFG